MPPHYRTRNATSMSPWPPYQINHPHDYLPPWPSHPFILPLIIPQQESPPLRRRRANIRQRRNLTYARSWHNHPYAPPQQRRHNQVEERLFDGYELEDIEPQYYEFSGEAEVEIEIEIEIENDVDVTQYGNTLEAELAIQYLPPVDAPEDAEVEDCPICIDKMRQEDRANPIAELPCGHPFHVNCIMKWLYDCDHNTCPVCRFELQPDE